MSTSTHFPHTLPRCFGNLSKSVASTYNCRYCFFLPHIVHALLARLGFPLFFDPSSRKNKQKTNWTKLGKFCFLGVVFFHLFFFFSFHHLKPFSIPACACARLRCLLQLIYPSYLFNHQHYHASPSKQFTPPKLGVMDFFPPIFIYFCASLFLCSCLFILYSLCSCYARCSSYRTLPYLTLFLSVMFPPLFFYRGSMSGYDSSSLFGIKQITTVL